MQQFTDPWCLRNHVPCALSDVLCFRGTQFYWAPCVRSPSCALFAYISLYYFCHDREDEGTPAHFLCSRTMRWSTLRQSRKGAGGGVWIRAGGETGRGREKWRGQLLEMLHLLPSFRLASCSRNKTLWSVLCKSPGSLLGRRFCLVRKTASTPPLPFPHVLRFIKYLWRHISALVSTAQKP